jgi:hypothetical protein
MFLRNLPWLNILPWVLGVVAVVGSYWYAYDKGFDKGDDRATQRIAAYEKQIKDKGAKIENGVFKINETVRTEYKTKTQKIYVERDVNRGLAQNVVKSNGNLAAGWVYVHNLAAQGGVGDVKKAADATDSQVSTKKALEAITENYAVCKAEVAKLQQWQSWYQQAEITVKAVNGTK